MLPNDNVSMSIGHLDHVLIVYSSKEFNFVASVYRALHSPYPLNATGYYISDIVVTTEFYF